MFGSFGNMELIVIFLAIIVTVSVFYLLVRTAKKKAKS